jgi:hypothetical protein
VPQAATVLLGDGARGRTNRLDFAAALGERLAGVLSESDVPVIVGRATEAARDRLGRRALGAFPEARERLPLATHREGLGYDGTELLAPSADAERVGQSAARFWRQIGLTGEAAVPRCTGSTEQRLDYLLGYLSASSPVPDLHPCG